MRIVDADRCYRRGRRKRQDLERRQRQLSRDLDDLLGFGQTNRCPECGKPGPHFVGPSLGQQGFFICATR
jgi:hypothetical protein